MNYKRIMEIASTVLMAILLEIMCFNFTALRNTATRQVEAIYNKQQLSLFNWKEADGDFVSEVDPMIFIEGVGIKASSFTVKLDVSPMPQSITIFYTTGANEAFSADKMLIIDSPTGDDTVQLDERISAIRVDPGEDAGITLHDATFIFNEVRWDISIARIVAMLVIYWGAKFLMSLQKTPDYGAVQED